MWPALGVPHPEELDEVSVEDGDLVAVRVAALGIRVAGIGDADGQQLLGHVGEVKWSPQLSAQNVSSERLRKSPLRDALVGSPLLTALRRTLIPRRARDRIKAHWQMRDRPQLGADTRSRVEREFDADLARLGLWFGVPLSCDNFAEVVCRSSLAWAVRL